MKLQGQVAALTGGGSGLGRATAEALASEGARIVLGDINLSAAEAVAAGLKHRGADAVALQLDVTRPVDSRRLVQAAIDHFGQLDIFLPIAGVNSTVSLWEMTEEEWDRVMAINLKGPFWGCQAASRVFKDQGHGRIVLISSLVAKVGGITSSIAYSASKAGIEVLTKSLAKTLAPYHVNVNCISPGPIDTPFHAGLSREQRDRLTASIPLGRFGRPDDIARAVVFLCSDDAAWITGEVLDVNGGMLID
jgi:NAD(P)-dependent dehydrogenase (short-subunit alcohol dehydrogenase family)